LLDPALDLGDPAMAERPPQDALLGHGVDEVKGRVKQGFGAPMAEWLARADVAELVGDALADRSAPIYDLLDPNGVAPFVTGEGQPTWNLLSVAVWAGERARA
ncbi:MAG: asparagine synthase-related protein, partial [Actinomycetota bacterium]